MGVLAICIVSIKGEIGCVVKNSFISYQRVAALIQSFSASMEDIRISSKSASRSTLGGKRIEDVYPIAEPIPIVIGEYRLQYFLINDIYIIVIDLDHHSPFLALDVMDKVRDVVCSSMPNGVAYSGVEINKVMYYYAFRRCINGMEGVSVLHMALRQIRLAEDPYDNFARQNAINELNDVIHPGEITAEVRDYTRDAWEAVLHLEGRFPADLKKKIKSDIQTDRYDNYFDTDAELPYHQVPETATTPMADLIVDEEYNTNDVVAPLNRILTNNALCIEIEASLAKVKLQDQSFTVYPLSDIKSADEAICKPPEEERSPKEGDEVEEGIDDEADEAEEEINIPGEDIHVDVPKHTGVTPMGETTPATEGTPAVEQGSDDDEGELEEVRVIQIDGKVVETIKVEQGPKREIRKQGLKGQIFVKTVAPDGIPEGTTAAKLIINNAGDFDFSVEEGICKVIDDSGANKVFEINLPTQNKEEMVHVLSYIGPVPDNMVPCFIECASLREGTTTRSSLTAVCNSTIPSSVTNMTCFLSPPLLSGEDVKKTFHLDPKGGFLKKSQKCRWTNQSMVEGSEYVYSSDITEPVDISGLEENSAPVYCSGEIKGEFNGIVSGIRPAVGEETDPTLGCNYMKHEFIANSGFTLIFNP